MYALYNGFVYLVWFLATFYTIFIMLSLLANKHRIFENRKNSKGHQPCVTFLVPAYDEEKGIADTIKSLKRVNYQKAEFIILNDGSRDKTSEIIKKEIRGDSRFIFVDNKENKGKAATLNQGIGMAKGEYIACMDADSIVEKNIVTKVIPYFEDEKVGAVTVSVYVRNPKSWLEKMIAMEYIIGLSLFLKVYSFMDCIFVTPGPFSMFRAKVLKDIGGFDINNITEDLEVAYRIQKSNHTIKNCIEAKVSTRLPSGFKKIYIQRRRWYSGALRTLIQHRDVLFRKRYRLFGFFMPYNYILIILGLGLFIASLYIFAAKMVRNVLYYQYTGFNFLDHLKFSHDILTYGSVNLLGMSMLPLTIFIMIVGLMTVKRKFASNKAGLIAYPFMFFFYQLFWAGSILAILKGRRLKWR